MMISVCIVEVNCACTAVSPLSSFMHAWNHISEELSQIVCVGMGC